MARLPPPPPRRRALRRPRGPRPRRDRHGARGGLRSRGAPRSTSPGPGGDPGGGCFRPDRVAHGRRDRPRSRHGTPLWSRWRRRPAAPGPRPPPRGPKPLRCGLLRGHPRMAVAFLGLLGTPRREPDRASPLVPARDAPPDGPGLRAVPRSPGLLRRAFRDVRRLRPRDLPRGAARDRPAVTARGRCALRRQPVRLLAPGLRHERRAQRGPPAPGRPPRDRGPAGRGGRDGGARRIGQAAHLAVRPLLPPPPLGRRVLPRDRDRARSCPPGAAGG